MFIGRNMHKLMRQNSLPGGDEPKELAVYIADKSRDSRDITYAESDSNRVSAADEQVVTLYTDNAYLFAGSADRRMYPAAESRASSDDARCIENGQYIQLIIPERNITVIGADGTLRGSVLDSDGTLQIGCKVFDISRSGPVMPISAAPAAATAAT